MVERLTEAHRVEEHLRLHVGGVVEVLLDADRVDALGEPGDHERQQVVREAGVDARGEAGGAALLARAPAAGGPIPFAAFGG